ncbi:MAG: hypothetical protein A2Y10_08760 [Planctomycetes bacterium GWF2_41_51]|nr:MAG: hypothetical protein A2Y10_08760 [Planctomycetes bacterium GWF2_41_51]HBG28354.1 hypothetical protein [Phycisphaerales bacterium]
MNMSVLICSSLILNIIKGYNLLLQTTWLIPYLGDLLKFYGLNAGFVLTLYALYTKDIELRQNRRELNRVLIYVLFAFILQCFAWVLFKVLIFNVHVINIIILFAIGVYTCALLYFFSRVIMLAYLRVEKFKERSFWQSIKHFPLIRIYVKKKDLKESKHYEKDPQERIALNHYPTLTKLIGESGWEHEGAGFSFLIAYKDSLNWIKLIAAIVKEHIDNGETITLVTCRHHPSHIIRYLESAWKDSDQKKLRNFMVIIDGFTKSFGGDDEIFPKSLQENIDDGYAIFSASSIPSIHSGCAQAFKYFKKTIKGKRLPGTVIYDGLLIYRHSEAEEFINRFLVHMVEAERTYSMATIIGEPYVDINTTVFKSIFSLVDYSRICEKTDSFKQLTYKDC